jgi:hypothetical protein
MSRLVIHSLPGTTTSFPLLAVVGLPVEVESAGWIRPSHGNFRVWINCAGESRTLQFNVTPAGKIDQRDPLPLVAAGAADCGDNFIVTGADDRGLPVVAGTDQAGRLLWLHLLEGPPPFRWPIPGCGRHPAILWQTEQGRAETAAVSADGLARQNSFAVGGPPLDLQVALDSAWAVWADASGIWALETSAMGARKFHLSESYASEIAVRCSPDLVWVAWGREGSAFLARKTARHDAFEEPLKFDVRAASGGILEIIPGSEPLVHARRGWLEEGKPARILSVLTGPGYQPLTIEGMVYSIATQDDTVVLLGGTELVFLGRVSGA